MSKRAVLYARVSGDDRAQHGRNLAGQIEMGRKFAQERGYEIVAELSEDVRGVSGARWDAPELEKALDMAEGGQFDVLIVRELDRFSRTMARQLVKEQQFIRAGVTIEYVLHKFPDTAEGQLLKHITVAVAEYEREKITERMRRGRRLMVRGGSVLTHGSEPYGYIATQVGGRSSLGVIQEEADIVHLIFKWYTSGKMGTKQIADRLSELRVPTYADTRRNGGQKTAQYGEWSVGSVNKILRNETYCGTWHYGKSGRIETADGSKKRVDNPRADWIAVDVPAIVSRETWEAAQQQLKTNWDEAKRNHKYNYLLRFRTICGDCGSKMRGVPRQGRSKVYLYYQCATPHYSARPCNNRTTYSAAFLDKAVWAALKEIITDPDRLEATLDKWAARYEGESESDRQQVETLERLIGTNKADLDRLIDLYVSGTFEKEALLDRKMRLEDTIRKLEAEHARLVANMGDRAISQAERITLRDYARAARETVIIGDMSFKARREIVEITKTEVTLYQKDGEKFARVRSLLWSDPLRIDVTPSGRRKM
jgi:site-specific DNA recombinase